MTAKEAQQKTIYFVEKGKIKTDNLYDFIMKSAEETTSPVGVMNKLHVRHEDYSCRYGRLNNVINDDSLFEVWDWGFRGQFSQILRILAKGYQLQ